MAIYLGIHFPGGRGSGRTEHHVTAHEISHVRLAGDVVGLNIDGGGRGCGAVLRMEIEEARMLAAMLLEGADRAERALPEGTVRG